MTCCLNWTSNNIFCLRQCHHMYYSDLYALVRLSYDTDGIGAGQPQGQTQRPAVQRQHRTCHCHCFRLEAVNEMIL